MFYLLLLLGRADRYLVKPSVRQDNIRLDIIDPKPLPLCWCFTGRLQEKFRSSSFILFILFILLLYFFFFSVVKIMCDICVEFHSTCNKIYNDESMLDDNLSYTGKYNTDI